MSTAINFVKLFLLITTCTGYFVGLGWLVVGPLLHGNYIHRRNEISRIYELALILISGLIINYGVVLVVQSLRLSFIVGGVLAFIGLILYLLMLVKSSKNNPFSKNDLLKLLGIVLVCGLFLGPILFIPLMEWDPRSIWFFHAKMIFSSGFFSQITGWQNSSVIDISHADYPNLVPTMAGQITYLMGFWNEYLPKLSLLFLLIPAVLHLFSFSNRSFSFFSLIILVIFSFSPKLWDGHMDGYLAVFLAISMLLLGRYFKDSNSNDLFSSLLCLTLLPYLKNEGALAVIAGFCSILFVILIKKTHFSIKTFVIKNWKFLIFFLLLTLPFGIWTYYKRQWGLSNDLGLGTNQMFEQISIRLNDGSLAIISEKIISQLENGLMLLGLLIIASLVFLKRISKVVLPAIIAAGIYSLGMVVIYLATPLKLINHLNDSVSRTMLTVNACIFIACYLLILNLEKDDETKKNNYARK